MNNCRLPDQILTEQDVHDFFCYLFHVESTSFHPDDSFGGYINSHTREPAFDESTCKKYDALMDQCHTVCAQTSADRIYEIGLNICHPHNEH
jgi:hypothetical protein